MAKVRHAHSAWHPHYGQREPVEPHTTLGAWHTPTLLFPERPAVGMLRMHEQSLRPQDLAAPHDASAEMRSRLLGEWSAAIPGNPVQRQGDSRLSRLTKSRSWVISNS